MVALTAGVGSVAHDVHYAVLVLGLLGLAALLAPGPSSPGTGGDEHDQRVAALRAQLAAGPGSATATTTIRPRPAAPPAASPVSRLWHPLAVVSTVTAAGVPEEFRDRLFDEFARADGAAVGGVGLGLHIVPSLAEAHGGAVGHRPGDEGGAVFTLSLPGTG